MSLALAAHSLSEALEKVLTPVHVVVDTPSATAEMTKSNTNEDFLNIFLYRVAPSATHAAQGSNQPVFLRVFALLTPFARRNAAAGGNGNGNGGGGGAGGGGAGGAAGPEDYPDLQILTDVIRHFHEHPVSEVMHTNPGGTGTAYRIHAIPQAPEMEELNHIWTTQNSSLGYRLSAVFEFALVPIDPTELAPADPPVRSTMAQVSSDLERRDENPVGYEADFSSFPGAPADPGTAWDGPPLLPQVLARDGTRLTATLDISADATEVALRLAGPTDFRARLTTIYRDAAGEDLGSDDTTRTIYTPSLAEPAGDFAHPLELPDGTATIVISVRAVTAGGADLTADRVGSTITLTVKEAG